MSFALRVVSAPGWNGGELLRFIPGERAVAGRQGLGFGDHACARQHSHFDVSANALEVVDLGSTNGTFVNGEKVKRAMLGAGDEVWIGNCRYAVVDVDGDPSTCLGCGAKPDPMRSIPAARHDTVSCAGCRSFLQRIEGFGPTIVMPGASVLRAADRYDRFRADAKFADLWVAVRNEDPLFLAAIWFERLRDGVRTRVDLRRTGRSLFPSGDEFPAGTRMACPASVGHELVVEAMPGRRLHVSPAFVEPA